MARSLSACGMLSAMILFSSETSFVRAQTVQLPAFRLFSATTTVIVPDRGSAVIGGNSSAYSGSQSRGLPLVGGTPLTQSHGIAAGGSTGSLTVTATIHDFEEMDRQLLGMPVEEFQRQVTSAPRRGGHLGLTPREVAREAALIDARKAERAQEHFDLALTAIDKGKLTLAQMYLRMAIKDAGPELRGEILAVQRRLAAPNNTVSGR